MKSAFLKGQYGSGPKVGETAGIEGNIKIHLGSTDVDQPFLIVLELRMNREPGPDVLNVGPQVAAKPSGLAQAVFDKMRLKRGGCYRFDRPCLRRVYEDVKVISKVIPSSLIGFIYWRESQDATDTRPRCPQNGKPA